MIKHLLRTTLSHLRAYRARARRKANLDSYLNGGSRPWSRGYAEFKEDYIIHQLANGEILRSFREGTPLPENYGEFLDERVIEHPWVVAHLTPGKARLLDAGAGLNFSYLIDQPILAEKEITIVTLEPESENLLHRRVGYLFEDLRHLPFRDGWFDEIVSVSTIEHIGMDNSLYSQGANDTTINRESYLDAISELHRVLRPGGRALITVPFGTYTDNRWFQQFDATHIARLLERFCPKSFDVRYFRYDHGGWQLSTEAECRSAKYFNWQNTKYCNPESTLDYDDDFAAAARAVSLLILEK